MKPLLLPLRQIAAIGFLASSSIAFATSYSQWALGQEREVDTGYYAKLIYQQNGWRVWRFENKNGVSCQAAKSARGKPHPVPLGFRDRLHDGTPFISISRGYENAASVDLHGAWGYDRDWRKVGAKFWNEEINLSDIMSNNGQVIEVHTATWEYPELRVGIVEERGLIDLSGLSPAIDALATCDPTIVFNDKL